VVTGEDREDQRLLPAEGEGAVGLDEALGDLLRGAALLLSGSPAPLYLCQSGMYSRAFSIPLLPKRSFL
jgi:hypothetical protein